MMKTQIGLGVLSIPSTFDSLGMIPGIICLCAIAAMTTWSNYIVGTFKLRHPEVYGIDDVGALMFGRIGREVFGLAIFLCQYIVIFLREGSPRLEEKGYADTGRLDLCCWVGNA